MSRLFWKIFIAFWGSLILFSAATVIATNHFIERMREDDSGIGFNLRVQSYVREARQVGANDGVEGLDRWLRQLDRREAVPFLLINEAGVDLLERPVATQIARRIRRSFVGPPPLDGRPPPPPQYIVIADGTRLLLTPDIKGLTLSRVVRRPRVLAIPVLIAAIASALVGGLLARYLTAPIARLRRATHKISSGDFTHRVQPEIGRRRDEIADLATDFDSMATYLQALIGSQQQLLSDVSHELRSPLARMQVALELARQRSGGTLSRELERIEQESERLNDLVGQLLSLTRFESQGNEQERVFVDLNAILHDVVDDANYESVKRHKHVTLKEQGEVTLEANDTLLLSAFDNIVRNALKYTPSGAGVEVELQQSTFRASCCLVTVRDHGPGVPEEMLERVFEPFVRVGQARDRDSGGYGLGLSIAQRAIRLHDGRVTAQNHPDGGLLVSIELPF